MKVLNFEKSTSRVYQRIEPSLEQYSYPHFQEKKYQKACQKFLKDIDNRNMIGTSNKI